MVKIRELALKGAMPAVTAISHARSGRTGALTINRIMRRLQAFRRKGESEIIIRTQEQYAATTDFCLRRRINLFHGGAKNFNALGQ